MKLDLKKFCSLLSQTKEQPRIDENVNRYLLDHVLTPALNGVAVLIGDIDFSQFDEEDIEILAGHYDSLDDAKRDAARLEAQITSIPPIARKVRAFC